jgi:ABC-type multidrug transport system fused ATPase/permease subunit
MSKVRVGEMVAAAGGVLLLVVMFLPWYGVRGREETLTAWAAFSVVDIVLALAAVLGILLLVVQVVGRGPAGPVALGVIVAVVSIVAFVLAAYRILNQPGPNEFVSVRVGAWLGLLATAVSAGGTWVSISDERPRPVDPPSPEPERRPTPARS